MIKTKASRAQPKTIYRTDDSSCCSFSAATRWTCSFAILGVLGLSYFFILPNMYSKSLRSFKIKGNDKSVISPSSALSMVSDVVDASVKQWNTIDASSGFESLKEVEKTTIQEEVESDQDGAIIIPQVKGDSTHVYQLAFVPFSPPKACDYKYEKLTCNVTILFQQETPIPLSQIHHDKEKEVCDQLPATFPAGRVPVCVQNANTVGILVWEDNSGSLQVVASLDDTRAETSIDSLLQKTTRVIELKRIDFPGVYKGIADTENKEWERFRDDNYGNMVWRYASSMILNQATTEVDPSDRLSMPELKDGPVDAFVIATANTLHLTEKPLLQDLVETMTNRVVLRNLPTIVIGMGIQIDFGTKEQNYDLASTDLALTHDFQTDFLRQVSKQQKIPSIGVRGDMTKAVCENSGIHNCVSMGCPSLTISRDRNLGSTLENNWHHVLKRLEAKDKTIKIAMTCPAKSGKTVDIAHAVIANILEEYGDQVTIIEQSKEDMPNLENFLSSKWAAILPTTNLNISSVQSKEFVNVESWLAGAKDFDLCISFRIHGSMTFIASGVPTIATPTDFRIMELLSAMKIPYQLPDDLEQLLLDDLDGKVEESEDRTGFILSIMRGAKNTNFTAFEINRREKIKGWKNILDQAGLEMDPALIQIYDEPIEDVSE
jgi:Polysaccharide pyruvyl transferase